MFKEVIKTVGNVPDYQCMGVVDTFGPSFGGKVRLSPHNGFNLERHRSTIRHRECILVSLVLG